MPWHIVSDKGSFKVVSNATGKVMGTHPSREKATKQLKALYANVPEAVKKGKK